MRRTNIIISPFSNVRKFNEKEPVIFENAKNFPYWRELVGLLRLEGYFTAQIGIPTEKYIGTNVFLNNKKLSELPTLIRSFDLWLSVDNFLPHLVHAMCPEKKGIVIFSRSDPKIFGYEENINLLKSRNYLRKDQYGYWWDCEFIKVAFPSAEYVFDIIKQYLQVNSTELVA